MDAQLSELLTGYGEIGGIWFDGWWDKPNADWRLAKTYKLIHDLQPAALVGSNHHLKPFPGEDFQMFEKDLPGHNTAGFNDKVGDRRRCPSRCARRSTTPGASTRPTARYKSTQATIVQLLVKAAGYDANLLLNVGPHARRHDPARVRRRVSSEVGEWLAKNGESIYGTRGGPLPPRPWGVTTQKGDKVFVHVLDWQDPVLALAPLSRPVARPRSSPRGQPVPFTLDKDALLLRLDPKALDPLDTIVVLELGS